MANPVIFASRTPEWPRPNHLPIGRGKMGQVLENSGNESLHPACVFLIGGAEGGAEQAFLDPHPDRSAQRVERHGDDETGDMPEPDGERDHHEKHGGVDRMAYPGERPCGHERVVASRAGNDTPVLSHRARRPYEQPHGGSDQEGDRCRLDQRLRAERSERARWRPMLAKPIANPWIATPTIEAPERRAVVSPSGEARRRRAATTAARKAKKPTPSARSPGIPTETPAIDNGPLIALARRFLCRPNASSLSPTSIYRSTPCPANEKGKLFSVQVVGR